MNKENIKKITLSDPIYPRLLKEISDPPQVLHLKGEIKKEDETAIAIVGTRNYTSYGKRIAEEITSDLVERGITIISGLAKGIDTFVHKTALEKGGRTIAVLGSGIDLKSLYPASNRGLAEKIINNGAILSEYPPGTRAKKYFFPQRNRIISGLSLGVIVIEAPHKSGALITANCALEQNREVFAVPGPVYSSSSEGTNRLIQSGAKLTMNANDVLEELNLPLILKKKSFELKTKEEEIIVKILNKEPLHLDEIIKQSKLKPDEANSVLIILELRGVVKNLGNNYFILNN